MIKYVSVLFATLLFTIGLSAQEATPDASPSAPPGYDNWDAVLEAARGTTVNWYMWGGDAAINEFVDSYYGDRLVEYDITLNRVPVDDTVNAVNLVISEAEAGIEEGAGSVDAIWINGENFYTLKQADLLYNDWSETLPNAQYVDWEDPAVAFDFGVPVDGEESPWSSAQFHFVYDTARMSEDDLPRSYDDLTTWIAANPGRFTYIAPGPGAFQGTRFVKQALYSVSGGADQWTGDWNPQLFDEYSPALWDLLNQWEPDLWRGGATYPASESELHQLFANGEIDFTITQAITGAGRLIESGLVPPTAKAFTFDDYMIGDYSYIAIPSAASNRAAAMVLANIILSPQAQATHIMPESGFGLGYAIEIDRVPEDERAVLTDALNSLGDATADLDRLRAAFAPDIAPESQSAIETGWESNVLLDD